MRSRRAIRALLLTLLSDLLSLVAGWFRSRVALQTENLSLGVALGQAHIAREQRSRAERRFNDVRQDGDEDSSLEFWTNSTVGMSVIRWH